MPPMDNSVGRTLILIKPDAIERGLTGEIIKRFERKGFRIIKAEMRFADEKLAQSHYEEHKGNGPYYEKMIDAITHGPVIAMILEGPSVIEGSRQLIGSASPHHSPVGTIRGDLAYQEAFNLVHGSDSNGAAYREITLWFSEEDAFPPGVDPQKKKKFQLKFNHSNDALLNALEEMDQKIPPFDPSQYLMKNDISFEEDYDPSYDEEMSPNYG